MMKSLKIEIFNVALNDKISDFNVRQEQDQVKDCRRFLDGLSYMVLPAWTKITLLLQSSLVYFSSSTENDATAGQVIQLIKVNFYNLIFFMLNVL